MKTLYRLVSNVLLISMPILLNGCGDNPVDGPPLPGEFNLTWLKGLRKVSPSVRLENVNRISAIDFDLGDINGSTDFYFVLTNVGGSAITHISLSVSDSSFSVYPQTIDTLLPADELDLREITELTLVRLTAIHGPGEHQIGSTSLMPAGVNSTTLTITGTTSNEDGQEQSVALSAEMQVNALLMDVRIWDGAREVDLLQPDGNVLQGGFVVPDFVKAYYVSDTVQVENMGSVPVAVTVFRTNVVDTVAVGGMFLVGDGSDTHVRFESDGIIRDLDRLPTYSDGKTYIFLHWE